MAWRLLEHYKSRYYEVTFDEKGCTIEKVACDD
jgi:hypothetical protein